jgi:hypothetical protein
MVDAGTTGVQGKSISQFRWLHCPHLGPDVPGGKSPSPNKPLPALSICVRAHAVGCLARNRTTIDRIYAGSDKLIIPVLV